MFLQQNPVSERIRGFAYVDPNRKVPYTHPKSSKDGGRWTIFVCILYDFFYVPQNSFNTHPVVTKTHTKVIYIR